MVSLCLSHDGICRCLPGHQENLQHGESHANTGEVLLETVDFCLFFTSFLTREFFQGGHMITGSTLPKAFSIPGLMPPLSPLAEARLASKMQNSVSSGVPPL